MYILAIVVVSFTLLQFIVAAFNLAFKPDLGKYELHDDPLISVLIPARNEENNMGVILKDLIRQSYSNIEIIVFDDQSTDQTPLIVEQIGESDPRIRLISSDKLPEGWLGKNFGCHSLSHQAKGDYLLFLDADVRIGNDIIQLAAAYSQKFNIGLLSIFPDQLMITRGEKMTVPIMNYILLSLLPLPLVLGSGFPSLAAANGQFMLFKNQVYKKLNPHEFARANKVEDITIARYFKQKGIPVACLTGNNSIQCHMYPGYDEAVRGFSKNITAFFGNSFMLATLFWFITTFGFIPVFIMFPFNISLLYIVILLMTRIVVSLASNQNVWINLLYLIPQQLTTGLIIVSAFTNKFIYKFQWKGRDIT